MPPVRAVLPASGGRDARWAELGAGGAGPEYLVERLLPWAAERYGTPLGPVVVAGQSLGGLTALRTGLLHPARIAAVVSASASLWQDDLSAEVAAATGSPLRVHLAHGNQEWVLAGPHEHLARRLQDAGVQVAATAYNGGHDYAWWRGAIADGLRWVLAR